jgi:hypothetical protein
MAVDEARRSRLFERLAGTFGEEAASTLFELLPPPDTDLATEAGLADLDARMTAGFAHIDQRFAAIDERFAGVDQRFAMIGERLDEWSQLADRRFEEVDRRLEQVDRRLDGVDRRLERLDTASKPTPARSTVSAGSWSTP